MPRIPLLGGLGLDAGGALGPGAKILDLLQGFQKRENWLELPLDKIPVANVRTGLVFSHALPPFPQGLGISLETELQGELLLVRAPDGDGPGLLPAIPAGEDDMYLGVTVRLSAGANSKWNWFGLSAGRGLEVYSYRRFERGANGFPSLLEALRTAADSFMWPRSAAEMAGIPPGSVVVLAGEGSIDLKGHFELAMPVEGLALSTAVLEKSIGIAPGATCSAAASIRASGAHRVRLFRSGVDRLEVALYALTDRKFQGSVAASADLGPAAAGHSLSGLLDNAIPQHNEPASTVTAAVPHDDATGAARRFESRLKEAADSRLQASIEAALELQKRGESAWTFDLDPAACLSPALAPPLNAALAGDFRPLTEASETLPGVRETANILLNTGRSRVSLTVNLVGLANLLSSSELASLARVERSPDGHVTLVADTSTSERVQIWLRKTGGDSSRLRRYLSDDFLIQAVYHSAGAGLLPPEFRADHVYLETHARTLAAELKNNLDVIRALGLLTTERQTEILGATRDSGQSSLFAAVSFTDRDLNQAFFNEQGAPRPVDEYERFGRTALGALLAGDAGQEFRRRYASLDSAGAQLWQAMKSAGHAANFPPLFGVAQGGLDPRIAAAGSDYFAIVEWAEAMATAAQAVHAARTLLSAPRSGDDSKFQQARKEVQKRLQRLAARSRPHFGDPLGLLMTFEACGRKAACRARLTAANLDPLEFESAASLTARTV